MCSVNYEYCPYIFICSDIITASAFKLETNAFTVMRKGRNYYSLAVGCMSPSTWIYQDVQNDKVSKFEHYKILMPLILFMKKNIYGA